MMVDGDMESRTTGANTMADSDGIIEVKINQETAGFQVHKIARMTISYIILQ